MDYQLCTQHFPLRLLRLSLLFLKTWTRTMNYCDISSLNIAWNINLGTEAELNCRIAIKGKQMCTLEFESPETNNPSTNKKQIELSCTPISINYHQLSNRTGNKVPLNSMNKYRVYEWAANICNYLRNKWNTWQTIL